MSDTDQQEILAIQKRFWDALKSKDREAFESMLAEDFVSRSPGEPNQSREDFISTLLRFPGQVVELGSDNLEAHIYGDTGILSGVQAARVRLPEGTEVDDVLAITNVLKRTNDGWAIIFSHSI